MKLKVDNGRAVEVFGKLLHQYKTKGYPFNQRKALVPHVEHNMPLKLKRGSLQHTIFLFVVCYWMRGGIDSITAFRNLSLLYDAHSWLFDPSRVEEIDPKELEALLRLYGLGYGAEQASQFWVENFRRLNEPWEGDPRNIFHDFMQYNEWKRFEVLCERMQNKKGKGFLGFQEKMVSMFIFYLMEHNLIPFFLFSLPVDFHVFRGCHAHKIIAATGYKKSSNGYIDEAAAALRKLSLWYSMEFGISSLDLCNALWIYSGNMCSNHPQNLTKIGARDGRNTKLTATPVEWSRTQVLAYDKSCGACVVNGTCDYFMRSAYYYIQGRIVIEKRLKRENHVSALFDTYDRVDKRPPELGFVDLNWRDAKLLQIEMGGIPELRPQPSFVGMTV